MCPEDPVLRVDVIDSKDDSTPPSLFIGRSRYQVDEGFACSQSAEPRTFPAIHQLKSELSIELDGTLHVTDRQGHCTNVLDQRGGSPAARALGIIPAEADVRCEAFSCGSIRIDGITYPHDVVI